MSIMRLSIARRRASTRSFSRLARTFPRASYVACVKCFLFRVFVLVFVLGDFDDAV